MHRETPPPSKRGPSAKNLEIANGLKADPNEWYRIMETNKTTSAGVVVSSIKKGTRGGFEPAGAFEATSRSIDGKGVVYARYVGITTKN